MVTYEPGPLWCIRLVLIFCSLKELTKYLQFRFEDLKRNKNPLTLFLLFLGVSLGTWKYGFQPTLLTVFIFISAFVIASLIFNFKYNYGWEGTKSTVDKGRVIFNVFLLVFVIVLQMIIWERFVVVCSVVLGLTYGLIMNLFAKT